MTKTCTYYFAPQSPWAYLGHARFAALAAKYEVQIDVRPVDLGKVFPVSGGLPLAKRAPQRQAYRLAELARWSDFLQVPLNLQPKFFPTPGDAAARLIIAARLAHGAPAAMTLTGAIMRALWAEERNIGDAATLAGIATACGQDGGLLLESADGAAVQQEYERYTADAIAANVFGSPWYLYRGEGFWGQDRLDFVERAFARD